MKRIFNQRSALLLLAALGLTQGCSNLGGEKAAPGSTSSRQFTSIVAHVDAANHIMTLSDEDGNEQTYLVSREITDLGHIQPGDQVLAEYYEDVVLVLEPSTPTATAGTVIEETRQRIPLGDNKNDERKVVITMLPAAVKSLDPTTRAMSLQDPEGRVRSMVVDEKQPIEGVKPGDILTVTYTEAIKVKVLAAR